MLDASLSPDKEPLPDYRTSDPKLLGAVCRILRSLLTRTPVDYRDRAPKAHTRFHPTSPMRTPIDYRRRPSVQAYPWSRHAAIDYFLACLNQAVPTSWAGGVGSEPAIDAFDVKSMVALGQNFHTLAWSKL
ncbi:hypothetical protein AgCh_008502 [Apium graveolens]